MADVDRTPALDEIASEDFAEAHGEWAEATYDPDEPYDYWNPVDQGYYDDDPSPYAGDYSEC